MQEQILWHLIVCQLIYTFDVISPCLKNRLRPLTQTEITKVPGERFKAGFTLLLGILRTPCKNLKHYNLVPRSQTCDINDKNLDVHCSGQLKKLAQLHDVQPSFTLRAVNSLSCPLTASLEKHRAQFPQRMNVSMMHLCGCYWSISTKKLRKVPHR